MCKLHDNTQDYEYKLGTDKSDSSICPYYHVANENTEFEVAPEQVDLSSFKLHSHLDSRIWNKNLDLNPIVRKSLLEISDDFWETCDISWIKPVGIILAGSICNFNWSKFSDIDLHLIVDFKSVHNRTDFVQEYFDEKKNDWNDEHKNLKMFNYPVELYVQDINSDVKSGGIFDLNKNSWISKPKRNELKSIKPNEEMIKEISSEIMTKVDDLIDEFKTENDKHKIDMIGINCDRLLSKIMSLRKGGLKEGGEMSVGNIVYKTLRRTNYIDKIWELSTKVYDKLNSVDKSLSFNEAIKKQF